MVHKMCHQCKLWYTARYQRKSGLKFKFVKSDKQEQNNKSVTLDASQARSAERIKITCQYP
jgi:hypothetical protein